MAVNNAGSAFFQSYPDAKANESAILKYISESGYFYSPEERNQRFLDRQAIFSREIAVSERIALIQKYNLRFLWLKSGEYSLVKNLLAEFPARFTEHRIAGYYLIEVHPAP